MRMMFFAAMALASSAHAQKFECPRIYPAAETALPDTPAGRKGTGRVSAGIPLSGGGVYEGDLDDRVELQGRYQKLKGGYDVQFGFPGNELKWLVCTYGQGGEVRWFEEIGRQARACTLQVRSKPQGEVSVSMICK